MRIIQSSTVLRTRLCMLADAPRVQGFRYRISGLPLRGTRLSTRASVKKVNTKVKPFASGDATIKSARERYTHIWANVR